MKRPSGYIAFFFLILFSISQLAYPLHILGGAHAQDTEGHALTTKTAVSGDHSLTPYEWQVPAHHYCDCPICLQHRTAPAFGGQLPPSVPVFIPFPATRIYAMVHGPFLPVYFTGDHPLRAPPAAV